MGVVLVKQLLKKLVVLIEFVQWVKLECAPLGTAVSKQLPTNYVAVGPVEVAEINSNKCEITYGLVFCQVVLQTLLHK